MTQADHGTRAETPFAQRLGRRVIHTEIQINAAPESVWAVLIDFPSYPQWNPFITRARKEPGVGGQIEITVRIPDGPTRTFRARVLHVEAGRELRWMGTLPVPGLCSGEHVLHIEPAGGGSRFLHGETFTGLLVPFMDGLLRKTERGYALMNQALKARVERIRPS